jgi:prepilin-type N-terminal cleavage/methylation domain-containing protein
LIQYIYNFLIKNMFQQKAFTLIETIITVLIIAILAGFVFVQINDSINSGKDAKRKADVALLANAVVSYSSDHYSSKPINVNGCNVGNNCSSEVEDSIKMYLSNLPNDPNSGVYYKYRSDGTNCFVSTVLSDGKIFEYECDTDVATTGLPVPGACGIAANTPSNGYAASIIDWPTSNFCTAGTADPVNPFFPNQGASVSWTCIGDFLGSTTTCTAYHALDGVCGGASRTYADAETPFGTYTPCAVGTPNPSPTPPAKVVSVSWVCTGLYGGNNSASCTARHSANGVCGSANNTNSYTIPSGNPALCNPGTAGTVTLAANDWTWTCAGLLSGNPSGTCATHKKIDAVCGSNVQAYAYSVSGWPSSADTAFCSAGTAPSPDPVFPVAGGSRTWTCAGINGGTSITTCTATRAATPINGVCGTNAQTYAYSVSGWPSTADTAFCTTGTAPSPAPVFPTAGNSRIWTCAGINGGTSVTNCTAVHNACVLTAHYPAMTCGYQTLCSQYAWCPCNGYDVTYNSGCSLPERWGSPGSCSWSSRCIRDNYCEWDPCTRTCTQTSDGNFCMP